MHGNRSRTTRQNRRRYIGFKKGNQCDEKAVKVCLWLGGDGIIFDGRKRHRCIGYGSCGAWRLCR